MHPQKSLTKSQWAVLSSRGMQPKNKSKLLKAIGAASICFLSCQALVYAQSMFELLHLLSLSIIKLSQLISRLSFADNLPKFVHFTPLLHNLNCTLVVPNGVVQTWPSTPISGPLSTVTHQNRTQMEQLEHSAKGNWTKTIWWNLNAPFLDWCSQIYLQEPGINVGFA